MKDQALYEVVTTLVGPIDAVGETRADDNRLTSLETMTWLVDRLVSDIATASGAASRYEASMKAIGVRARVFLSDLRESLGDFGDTEDAE